MRPRKRLGEYDSKYWNSVTHCRSLIWYICVWSCGGGLWEKNMNLDFLVHYHAYTGAIQNCWVRTIFIKLSNHRHVQPYKSSSTRETSGYLYDKNSIYITTMQVTMYVVYYTHAVRLEYTTFSYICIDVHNCMLMWSFSTLKDHTDV